MAGLSSSTLAVAYLLGLLTLPTSLGQVTRSNGAICDCGFKDSSNGNLYTEALIVYFNETLHTYLDNWESQTYENKRELGWNTIYRQGASASNVALQQGSDSLDLLLDPSTAKHLVMGASVQTKRKDIQYGSFRTRLRPPGRDNEGGSALSMLLRYNDTQDIELMLANTNNVSEGWAGTFVNGEFPSRQLGVNFSEMTAHAAEYGYRSPWEFTSYKVDWSEQFVNFSIGSNMTRVIRKNKQPDLPNLPMPIQIKHWCTGNIYSMQGPPLKHAAAGVESIQFFFNGTSNTTEERGAFNRRCTLDLACSVDDSTLRGATQYHSAATKSYVPPSPKAKHSIPVIGILSLCLTISTVVSLHAIYLWHPWKRFQSHEALDQDEISEDANLDQISTDVQRHRIVETRKDANDGARSSNKSVLEKEFDDNPRDSTTEPLVEPSLRTIPSETTLRPSSSSDSLKRTSFPKRLLEKVSKEHIPPVPPVPPAYASGKRPRTPGSRSVQDNRPDAITISLTADDRMISGKSSFATLVETDQSRSREPSGSRVENQEQRGPLLGKQNQSKLLTEAPSAYPSPLPAKLLLNAKRQRVDYLAGILALCAIIVTVQHFCLSYNPASIIPGGRIVHHSSEDFVRQYVSPFVLSQLWLGVFFTSGSRFLCDRYLADGDLRHIASIAVRRVPRFMIPVTAVVLVEYFAIDAGATNYLEYTPSITWSQWPYVERFPSFGIFLNELLELVYLIPNGFPRITFHYCTGVLWTVAVQLQSTWLILLAIVVIREFKRTWKRILFYIFVIVTNWYAQSWGSYFYVGILLTDLDITFKYRKWLYSHSIVYYPIVVTCALLAVASLASNLAPAFTSFNFSVVENDWHPDYSTAMPLALTPRANYPDYFVPRLNGLVFAATLQLIIEVSPWAQYMLSCRLLQLIFPHIFTIYLIHGLIFWSWGSWLLCFLADRGYSYSISLTIVGITSYGILVLSLPILTPMTEVLGQDVAVFWWSFASSKQPPKRSTLFPYSKSLLSTRQQDEVAAMDHSVEVIDGGVESLRAGLSSRSQEVEVSAEQKRGRFTSRKKMHRCGFGDCYCTRKSDQIGTD